MGPTGVAIELPSRPSAPLAGLSLRIALALGLVGFVTLVAFLGRAGYADSAGGHPGLLDSLYYATVSVTTTGYGDVRPETTGARLANTLLVTPARVLFLILLVGTTLEVLAQRTRQSFAIDRWRRALTEHTVICGFGTKGRSAVQTLIDRGTAPDQIVVIDEDPAARAEAQRMGLAAVAGNASRVDVLREAEVERAASVLVAPHADADAVLITLTAREMNPDATIVASVREQENAHLLRQSGATSVIVSAGSAGRLLGLGVHTPRLVDVLEDLLSVGEGMVLHERRVGPGEAGPLPALPCAGPVIAVVRDGSVLRLDDPSAREVQVDDCVVFVGAPERATGAGARAG